MRLPHSCLRDGAVGAARQPWNGIVQMLQLLRWSAVFDRIETGRGRFVFGLDGS